MDGRDLALAVECRELEAAVSRPTPTSLLFDKQIEVVKDPSRTKAVMCGRRAGKSILDAVWLFDGAMETAGSLSIYLTLTRKNAKLIVWPALQWVDRKMGLGCTFNQADLMVTLPNGSKILCGGCKDRAEIEKWRGPAYKRAVVDECGSFPPYLRELVRDVLRPASIDLAGEILLSGTPGWIWDGYWFETTGPHRKSKIPVYSWTMWDNPTLPHAGALAEEIKEEEGWDDESDTWVIEYKGIWKQVEGVLVFPWTMGRNQVDALPDLPAAGWRHVLGIDIGQVDATAYSLWAAHENSPDDYLLESKKAEGLLSEQVANDIRGYTARFPRCAIVMDTGGMGKQHAEEVRRRFGIPVQAAEKRDKESAIRVYRDQMRSSRVKLLAGECNDAVRDEYAVVRWNDAKTDIADGQNDHGCHSALYGHRRLRHYRYEKIKPRPAVGTEEWARAEEERMKAEKIKKIERDQKTPAWAR